jgi:DNA-binding transcriptional regulator GbsR (MarR family)
MEYKKKERLLVTKTFNEDIEEIKKKLDNNVEINEIKSNLNDLKTEFKNTIDWLWDYDNELS